MTNPIKRMIINHRRLRTPTCKTCTNYAVQFFQPACTCAKYLEHYNSLNCASVEYAILDDVRGTRFCEYEQAVVIDEAD